MPTAKVEFRKFHVAQREIYGALGRRNILRCGRRFGKTEMLETTFGRRAIAGRKIGWFTPEYKLMRPTFARMRKVLGLVIQTANKTDALIELRTGGSIEFWTLDNEDAGRSRDYDDVVIDEASLVKKGLREIIEQSIFPTLLDRGGTMTMAGTPKGIDPENFFYVACTEKELGWQEFHAPTRANPMLDPIGVAKLQDDFPPLVYQQEYLAEFVNWAGAAFFSADKLLVDNQPVPYPTICDGVFAIIDSAVKTGTDNDGTAVLYCALSHHVGHKLVILDWDIQQIEGALLETWLPTIFQNCEHLARQCRARAGALGVWIEDKSSGMVLLQQAARMSPERRRGQHARAIDSKLTSVGKDERAINVSGYVYQEKVKFSDVAYNKVTNYKGVTRNHLVGQVCGFRVGDKDAAKRADDLLDCFCYATSIALGNSEGF